MTLHEKIAGWLNDGARNYFLGVVYYSQYPGHDSRLYDLFRLGENAYRRKKLKEALLTSLEEKSPEKISQTKNAKLYEACLQEAKEAYKKCMNERAVLFAAARRHLQGDPNEPNLCESRGPAALRIVDAWKEVSRLYDRAAFVKEHGRLPDIEEPEQEFQHVPPHMVKQHLDNERKSLNKLKKKEQTPERVALIQKHLENVKKLEKQWRLLKSRK